ncbi:MAG: type II toxin-antitoxin system HicA family toxin [Candidatus Aenigmarchaeota archaeon]|nr:type II toxin-antitoxin system HicA family toxin [Candidatus Aenigmarchaeota archaeon]
MKLPLVTGQKMLKVLSVKGFVVIRQRSSHVQLKNEKGILITIPIHSGKAVSVGVLNKILRDAEISREEYTELVGRV